MDILPAIQIHPDDHVAVALQPIPAGTSVSCGVRTVKALSAIPAGHKIALTTLPGGSPVIKYGALIGEAVGEIPAGEWVHTHNLRSLIENHSEYAYVPEWQEPEPCTPETFAGYRRADGRAGIRNEVWILPTVGCVNAVAKRIEDLSQGFLAPGLDGIFSYSHSYGCSQLGDDQGYTTDFLTSLIRHPNAAGVLVIGLGCENGSIAELKAVLGAYDPDRVKFLTCQDVDDEIAAGVEAVRQLSCLALQTRREPCPVSDLVIGLKCGASDGFSGISANPLTGALTDKIVARGGAAILTEVPEMFGAERLLMNRCTTADVFRDTVELINGFKEYFLRYDQPVGENPSPGNREGGITTLEEKSLGCTQKAGSVPVVDVLPYAGRVRRKGLSLLCSPGNDLVSACALAASGAQLILFTTGRGTPFGCLVPAIKIASHTGLFTRKAHWMDFDAGPILQGASIPGLAAELLRFILQVASGEATTKSEALDKRELSIFKDGVIL